MTIAAGETSGTMVVAVLGDAVVEPDETFTVTLSNPVGATLGTPATATGTITNDDVVVPTVSIGPTCRWWRGTPGRRTRCSR